MNPFLADRAAVKALLTSLASIDDLQVIRVIEFEKTVDYIVVGAVSAGFDLIDRISRNASNRVLTFEVGIERGSRLNTLRRNANNATYAYC